MFNNLTYLQVFGFCFIFFASNTNVHASNIEDWLRAANAAAVAYTAPSTDEPLDEDSLLVSKKHYTGIRDSLENEGATVEGSVERDLRAVVVRFPEEENTAYVAFPGLTDGRHGLMKILSSARGDLTEIDMEGDCHGGVFPYYLSLREALIENLETLRKEGVNKFVFTGHCLGGAKATFAVVDFLNGQEDQDISVDLITFAQIPAVLPVEAARTLANDPRLESKDLWLENDLWTGFSSWLDRRRGFVHLSERTVIAPAQKEWWWNTHRLKTYIEALDRACLSPNHLNLYE